jgi:hypothetical protein
VSLVEGLGARSGDDLSSEQIEFPEKIGHCALGFFPEKTEI